jgi:6-phospho-beta-glucosidase
MKLAVIGGGGFRVPLVYGALLADTAEPRVEEVALYDVNERRLNVITRVLEQMAADADHPPKVSATLELESALDGADFVFSAIRVGGLAGRVADERVAHGLGMLGQETTGPGGVAYGLRTVPVALRMPGSSTSPTRPAWSPRRCPTCWGTA